MNLYSHKLLLKPHVFNYNLATCNFDKLEYYSESSSSSLWFFLNWVCKNILSLFIFWVVLIIERLYTKHILSLVVWIDLLIMRSEKSPPQTGAFIDIWVFTLKISPPKNPSQKASSRLTMALRKRVVNDTISKGKAIATARGEALSPSNEKLPPRTLAPPHLRKQPLVFNHCSGTKISSFGCLLQ